MSKILQVLGSLGRGGAETMVMNYYREAIKQGIQFDFIVHANVSNGYEDEVKSLGGKILLLNRPGKVGPIKYIRELKKAIRKNGPYSVVHSHTNIQGFLAVVAGRLAGVEIVATHSHSTNFTRGRRIINTIVDKAFGAKMLACGDEAGKALYGKQLFKVIPNAISVDYFLDISKEQVEDYKQSLGLSEKKIVGHIGRFVDQKNHSFLIRMITPVLKDNPDYILCLFGEGLLRIEIEKTVAKLKIDKQVRFMGVSSQMNLVYGMLDILVLPSKKEGLPVTILEAQAAGILCLCSDVITRECDMGINLVNYLPLNENIWRQTLQSKLNGRHEITSISIRKKALHRYDIASQSKVLFDIYRGE